MDVRQLSFLKQFKKTPFERLPMLKNIFKTILSGKEAGGERYIACSISSYDVHLVTCRGCLESVSVPALLSAWLQLVLKDFPEPRPHCTVAYTSRSLNVS